MSDIRWQSIRYLPVGFHGCQPRPVTTVHDVSCGLCHGCLGPIQVKQPMQPQKDRQVDHHQISRDLLDFYLSIFFSWVYTWFFTRQMDVGTQFHVGKNQVGFELELLQDMKRSVWNRWLPMVWVGEYSLQIPSVYSSRIQPVQVASDKKRIVVKTCLTCLDNNDNTW